MTAMKKEKFPFRLTASETRTLAIDILEKYERAGVSITLRGLYYQLVGGGHELSGDPVYKRLTSLITKARYNGLIPPWQLEDHNREPELGAWDEDELASPVDDVADAIENAIRRMPEIYSRRSRWIGQETYVSVWIEKRALLGTFRPICEELGVGLFACGGYASVTSYWDWLRNWARAYRHGGRDAVILYFGDHDPDGLCIPEVAEDRIDKLRVRYKLNTEATQNLGCDPFFDLGEVEFERVGLTLDQIRKYDLIPFPAKEESTRFEAYMEETGLREAWELDALDPLVLQELIRDAVEPHWDEEIYQKSREEVSQRIEELHAEMVERGYDLRGEA